MRTITDEQAFALGVRAVKAGMQPGFGVAMLTHNMSRSAVSYRFHGVVTDIGKESVRVTIGEDFEWNIWSRDIAEEMIAVPDLRDPGTKGHAVAQLRERTRDEGLCVARRPSDRTWHMLKSDGSWLGCGPTEEDAIVHTFEETKETP